MDDYFNEEQPQIVEQPPYNPPVLEEVSTEPTQN